MLAPAVEVERRTQSAAADRLHPTPPGPSRRANHRPASASPPSPRRRLPFHHPIPRPSPQKKRKGGEREIEKGERGRPSAPHPPSSPATAQRGAEARRRLMQREGALEAAQAVSGGPAGWCATGGEEATREGGRCGSCSCGRLGRARRRRPRSRLGCAWRRRFGDELELGSGVVMTTAWADEDGGFGGR
ncbi:hypothetical protein OsI_00776 [Oryza sativa Indica Group]|uniref:Uncharacterized protein n=1 Tax=Oryza sativa subsp. indica TaxID=39946 RepID=B8A6J4_ORYSI|nr:hypothetical protein OsI_00776 [Oryza sativa Indica Group]